MVASNFRLDQQESVFEASVEPFFDSIGQKRECQVSSWTACNTTGVPQKADQAGGRSAEAAHGRALGLRRAGLNQRGAAGLDLVSRAISQSAPVLQCLMERWWQPRPSLLRGSGANFEISAAR
jgi:hypothetical protein